MPIFLVQHGLSLPKTVDPEKGLSEQGIAEVTRIAASAKKYGVQIAEIIHSGKKRARQTAEIFAAELLQKGGVKEGLGMKPLDEVTQFANSIDTKKWVMYVGHLPFMERLTAYLVTGSSRQLVFRFQNSGVVCLNQNPDTKFWVITWSLMPKII